MIIKLLRYFLPLARQVNSVFLKGLEVFRVENVSTVFGIPWKEKHTWPIQLRNIRTPKFPIRSHAKYVIFDVIQTHFNLIPYGRHARLNMHNLWLPSLLLLQSVSLCYLIFAFSAYVALFYGAIYFPFESNWNLQT